MFIPLGCNSHCSSSCLPESDAGRIMAFLFGIAPDKAFLSTPVAGDAGGLLRHHFTLADSAMLNWRFVSVELALPRDSFPLGSIPPCGVRTFLCAQGTANICSSPLSILIGRSFPSIISFLTAPLSLLHGCLTSTPDTGRTANPEALHPCDALDLPRSAGSRHSAGLIRSSCSHRPASSSSG